MKPLPKKVLIVGGGLVGVFLVWRLATGASSNTSSEQSSDQSAGVPLSTSSPIIYPAMASVGGVSEGVSQGTGDASAAMIDYLKTIGIAQADNEKTAINSSTQISSQTNSMNSAVSMSVADSFAALLGTWAGDKTNSFQSLKVSADPSASGGLSLSVSKDVNLNAIPTSSQAANYQSGSALNNTAALTSLFTSPKKTVAQTKENFNWKTYLSKNSDVAKKWKGHYKKNTLNNAWEHYQMYGKYEGREFTPLVS